MNANVYIIKDYENETAFRPKKTNPNKANFKRALFYAKIGNFFPKKLFSSAEKAGEFAYLYIFFNLLNGELVLRDIIRAYFQESCLKFAENSGKNVKFGISVTFGITDGT